MKTHEEFVDLLPRYATLASDEQGELDRHLETCQVCAARLAIYQYAEREGASEVAPASERPRLRLALTGVGLALITLTVVAWPAAVPAPAAVLATALPSPTPASSPTPAPALLPGAPSPAVMDWLRGQAARLQGVEPASGLADLVGLQAALANARAVVLDDSTYGGTHEFLAFRQRLVELLIGQMGFDTVLADTSWSTGAAVERYLQGSGGDPAQFLLAYPGSGIQTQETLYTLRWLAEHNQMAGPAQRVHFAGFLPAAPDSPLPLETANAYLARVDPSGLAGQGGSDGAVIERLSAQRDAYIARSSLAEYDAALLAAEVAGQQERLAAVGDAETYADQYNGYALANLATLLKTMGFGRLLLLYHSSSGPAAAGGPSPIAYLRSFYGAQVVVLAPAFYQGAVYAPGPDRTAQAATGPSVHPMPPATDGSYEAYLHRLGLPRFLIDLRQAMSDGAAAQWLSTPHLLRLLPQGVDDCYPEDNFGLARLADDASILVFFDRVTPPTLLGRPPSLPPAACPDAPANLDFHQGWESWRPSGTAGAYIIGSVPAQGRAFIRGERSDPVSLNNGSLEQQFRADAYRGRRVRFRLQAATQATADAEIWLQAEGVGFQNLKYASLTLPDSGPAQPRELTLDVPADAVRILIGVRLLGPGQVTVDDLHFEVAAP